MPKPDPTPLAALSQPPAASSESARQKAVRADAEEGKKDDEYADRAIDPRFLRLERELRRSRRWQTVWAVGFFCVAMGVAGTLVVRELDLDAGPVGRWLHDRKADEAVSSQGEDKAIAAPASSRISPDASSSDMLRGEDGKKVLEGEDAGLVVEPLESEVVFPSEGQPHPDSAVPAADHPSDSSGASSSSDTPTPARLATLTMLRRLR